MFNSESLSSFFDSVILKGNLFEGQYQFVLASLSSINLSLWNDYRTDDAWVDFDFSNYFEKFKKVIESFKDSKRLWIWGAGTKGVLFLKHLCDCDEDVFKTVVGVVDVNPKKQNHFTPSTLIKIDSPESFFEESLNGDTVVVVNEQILGKPTNAGDASRMLHLLSGRHHEVVTGVTVIGLPLVGQERLRLTNFTTTRVKMAALSESEIEWYISTGEPLGKAGAYAIQGLASRFITHIEGSYSNVVGLPIFLLYSMLKKVISVTT